MAGLLETYDQAFPNLGPVVRNDRKQHRVADGAVVATLKATQCPFIASAEARNGPLGSLVADVGLELHPAGPKVLEGVREEEKLRFRIDFRAPYGGHVERGPNFQPGVRRSYLEVRRGPDDGPCGYPRIGLQESHYPDEPAFGLAFGEVRGELLGAFGPPRHMTPDGVVVERMEQRSGVMLRYTRREFDDVSRQASDGRRPRHAGPRRVVGSLVADQFKNGSAQNP